MYAYATAARVNSTQKRKITGVPGRRVKPAAEFDVLKGPKRPWEKLPENGRVKVYQLPPRIWRVPKLDFDNSNSSSNRVDRKEVNLTITTRRPLISSILELKPLSRERERELPCEPRNRLALVRESRRFRSTRPRDGRMRTLARADIKWLLGRAEPGVLGH